MRTQNSTVVLGVAAWLVLAVAAGLMGVMARAPGPAIGLVNFALTLAVLAALAFVPRLREWVMSSSLRPWIAYHVVRFVGLAFLAFAAVGRLPVEWATKAAWGDIAVAILAGFVAMAALPVVTIRKWIVVFAWNVIGLADILFVLAVGISIAVRDVEAMSPLREWPLVLLPTFVVPLSLVTHVLIFVRLFRGREAMSLRQTL